MSIKEDLLNALEKWAQKVDDPKYKEKFKDYNKTLMFVFKDQSFNLLMIFKDQTCKLEEGTVENPSIVITSASNVILGIANGEINPIKAFLTRKLKAKGSRKDLLKVQMLMK